jgi:hypothetical protein
LRVIALRNSVRARAGTADRRTDQSRLGDSDFALLDKRPANAVVV